MSKKHSFYEVIEKKLLQIQSKLIPGRLHDTYATEIVTYLKILEESSGIPASDAQRVAESIAPLPWLLDKTNHFHLRRFAEEVVRDLRNRVDLPRGSKFDGATQAIHDLGDPPTPEEQAEQDLIDHGC